ncbi:MAG: glycosyltransferase family 4 protein [Bryobacteraceae bacterium]
MQAIRSAVPILLLVRELGAGGSERQLTEIAKALDKARFEVHVGYFREGMRCAELTDAGIRTLKIGVTSFRKPEAVREALHLGGYLRAHRIMIVHTFDYPLTCFGVPVARAFGVPVVLSSQRGHRELIPASYRPLVRATDLLADGIVVNCHEMELHLFRDEDVPRRKIRLCYNGIDTDRYSPSSPPARTYEKAVTAGCVSVLRREKNLGLLLKAFSELAECCPELRLLIVGSGPEESTLRELAHQLGLGNRFSLRSAQNDVVSALREIDIFVLPSLTEALSNSLMEAMACGCAVIASAVGGNPELVDPERTGLLFENGNLRDLTDKIKRLVRDDALRKWLGINARQFIERQFSLERASRSMEEIYGDFLTQSTERAVT